MNTARLNQGTPLLLNAVSKHYAENIVLNQLDLHIPAGQFVAVVGRSGGGKSTLLRLLAGLETPTAGDVLAGTTPLAEIQDDTRMMFQDARLLPWKSVIDNVGLGLKGQWRDAARRALAAVGLENRAGEWPAALSGGQKQRVALARALIHRPGLLLLDEPLGALDALTRLEMQDLIVSLWQEHGFTVLLVTHDVSEAVAMADRVLLIEEGKIGLDLTVDIPRPRRLGSVRLAELEAEVLQRVMQRVLKRSGLPVWHTLGFNPHIYMTFACPLSLGQESQCECVDVKTEAENPDFAQWQTVLNAIMPAGIEVYRVEPVKMKADAIAYACYRIRYPADAAEKLAQYNALDSVPVEKKSKRGVRMVEMKEYVPTLELETEGESVSFAVCLPASQDLNLNPSLLTAALEAKFGVPAANASILRTEFLTADKQKFE